MQTRSTLLLQLGFYFSYVTLPQSSIDPPSKRLSGHLLSILFVTAPRITYSCLYYLCMLIHLHLRTNIRYLLSVYCSAEHFLKAKLPHDQVCPSAAPVGWFHAPFGELVLFMLIDLYLQTNIWERLKLIQRLKKDFASAKVGFKIEIMYFLMINNNCMIFYRYK